MPGGVSAKQVFIGALVAFLFAWPWINSNPYYLRIAMNLFVLIPVTIGVALTARVGQLNSAQAAFMSIGAYTVAILTTKMGVNFWAALPLGGAIAGLVALGVGIPTLRVRGTYFVIMTFGLNELVRLTWVKWEGLSKGLSGISGIPAPDAIGALRFGSASSFYLIGLVLMLLCTVAFFRIYRSHFGLTVASLGQADTLSESVGVNIMRVKIKTFVASSVVAGLMGGYYAVIQTYINPNDFGIWTSFNFVIFFIVGGAGAFAGPIYGAVVLTVVPILFQSVPGYKPFYSPMAYGVFVLVVVLAYPKGLVGLVSAVQRVSRNIWRRTISRPPKSPQASPTGG